MDKNMIEAKLKDLRNSFTMECDDFNDKAKDLLGFILQNGEYLEFTPSVIGVYYGSFITGVSKSKDGDVKLQVSVKHNEYYSSLDDIEFEQIPDNVVFQCVLKAIDYIPVLEEKRNRVKWMAIYNKHFKKCFMFWRDRDYDMLLSIKKALEDLSNMKFDPRVPKGNPVDKKLLDEFCNHWESVRQEIIEAIQNGKYPENEIRTCDICGLPMSEGYYLGGEYACDDDCCLACYDGDKSQMEEDLSHAEECDCETYYTEWDSIFFDD